MKPFLVSALSGVFRRIHCLTLSELLIRFVPEDKRHDARGGLTELWVLSNLALAVLMAFFLPVSAPTWLRSVVFTYATVRLVEMVVIHFYYGILGGYPERERETLHYKVRSLRRNIVFAMLTYLEVTFWYAVLYRFNVGCFSWSDISLSAPLKAWYFSVVTITTVGYGDVSARTDLGFALVISEVLLGFFFATMVLARVIAYLPAPRPTDVQEHPEDQTAA